MAHYAEIKNELVESVIVVNSISVDENDENAVNEYLTECGMPGSWLRCSYNTRGGQHIPGGEPFRYNYPGKGWTFSSDSQWSSQDGAFIPPKPYESWILNSNTALWEPPIPIPDQENQWIWNEETGQWQQA